MLLKNKSIYNDISEYSVGGAIPIVKKFEGCELKAYQCSAGVWTIGYGHTWGIKSTDTITQEQAETYLVGDLMAFKHKLMPLVSVKITENQFFALIDFIYNLGEGNFSSSTLRKKLNKGDFLGAAEEFPKWCRCKGEILNGLKKRREFERELFLKDLK